MAAKAIRSNDELWKRVGEVETRLREAGSIAEADRLHDAMSISAHPGEVWPETLAALGDLLQRQPPGLDEQAAGACAEYLAGWP